MGLSKLNRLSFERKDQDDLRSFQFQHNMCETVAAIAILVVVWLDAVDAVKNGKPMVLTRFMFTEESRLRIFFTSYGTYFLGEDLLSNNIGLRKGRFWASQALL